LPPVQSPKPLLQEPVYVHALPEQATPLAFCTWALHM
jgi:hypothetical protein